MNEALFNIQKLAASGYDPATLNVTRRANAAFSQIACINYQEVHDREIANAFLIPFCPGYRLQVIERRAAALLAEVARG